MQERVAADKERERNIFDNAMKEIGRLRAELRLRMLYQGATAEDIRKVLYPDAKT